MASTIITKYARPEGSAAPSHRVNSVDQAPPLVSNVGCCTQSTNGRHFAGVYLLSWNTRYWEVRGRVLAAKIDISTHKGVAHYLV